MKTLKRLSFLLVACVAGWSTWAWAAEAGNRMTITYQDGSKQSVPLDRPASEIANIDFSKASGGRDYRDSRGVTMSFPCGKRGFADRAGTYTMGSPPTVDKRASHADAALGEPDYVSDANEFSRPVFTAVTLGCGGSVVLEFMQARIIDVDGPDLYVFEVGAAVEPTQVEVSKDGRSWVNVGRVAGGSSAVDIHDHVQRGDQFRFVRVTDFKQSCAGEWPGADIDAVGAIGCAPSP